ncbi:MAG: type III-B CRISPR module RAMP protein Cmr4 [Candidatus Zixiibacteriota bacterium]
MSNQFEQKKYYALAIDPLHVGSGRTRLERVDLAIIREPGTNLPKIPGTSLSGPARAYTAMVVKKYKWQQNDKEFSCAGRGGEGGENHCGRVNPACEVCVPYGFSKGSGNSMKGLTQFFDAHILFFPVVSMVGPVWVTSAMAMEGLGIGDKVQPSAEDRFYPIGDQLRDKSRLNFGWLLLEKSDGDAEISLKNISEVIPEIVKQRSVLVSDRIFSYIVNHNLEIRTSVSIDPATGAAEEGALFTYEAIPRGTILQFDVSYNSGQTFKIGGKELKTQEGRDIRAEWVKTQVEKGFALFEILGIGGMNTRGMGRLKVLNLDKDGVN